jgi:plasmid maintenance system antidote protein VapI
MGGRANRRPSDVRKTIAGKAMTSELTDRKPAEVVHPSVIIKDELHARGWSLDELAVLMGDDPRINRLALDLYLEEGPRERNLRIGDFSSKQLGRAFGVSPDFFFNLEKAWLEAQPQ